MTVTGSVAIVLTIGLALASTNVGAADAPGPSEKAAIEKVIRDSICWALTKDKELQISTMAQDEDLRIIWTASDTDLTGWSRYVKLFDSWMDPRFKATLTEVHDLNICVSKSGEVAWFSARLDDLGEWDGRPVGDRDIRWTGVLEKREGRWLFVQMHGSVAKDKVAAQSRGAAAQ
jgi:hypothetical protein